MHYRLWDSNTSTQVLVNDFDAAKHLVGQRVGEGMMIGGVQWK